MFSISDLNELEIYITDGWREWYIPKFRLTMVVDEPYLTLYWTDSEKGSEGITRVLEMDYQDMLFGYSIPASASNAEFLIERFETSAWDNIDTTATTDGVYTDGDGSVLDPINLTSKSQAAVNVFNHINFI